MKSAKVKALCFHPQRPTLLAIGLFTGETQIWDFRNGYLIAEFRNSEHCVRAVDFHPFKALLATGGDDAVVHGYDLDTGKRAFELKGHIDFVRAVCFHSELPWLLSCSDDQTLRLWNWQSKSLLTVIAGHDHYVMCARFHRTRDLIVSAGLDSSLRVWNFAKLKSKFSASHDTVHFLAQDVEPLAVKEAHAKGVNWAEFHPTDDLIASCSDDKLVKLWRLSGAHLAEERALHGHTSNVSCVAFLGDGKRVASAAEDGTLRIWGLQGVSLHEMSRPGEKLWALALHGQLPFLALGGDSSFSIFALAPDRPAIRRLFRGGLALHWSARTEELEALAVGSGRLGAASVLARTALTAPRWRVWRVAANPFSANKREVSGVLHLRSAVGNERRLVAFSLSLIDFTATANPIEGERLIFLGAERALLCQSGRATVVRWPNCAPLSACELSPSDGFEASPGRALLFVDGALVLYDFARRCEQWRVADEELCAPSDVSWNVRRTHVALACKHSVFVVDKRGKVCCVAREDTRIRSVIWIGQIALYNTHEHVKFLLLNDDVGLLCTIDRSLVLVRVERDCFWAIDGRGELSRFETDLTEMEFKAAVAAGDVGKTRNLLQNRRFLGQATAAYLISKGCDRLAMEVVGDRALAFECALNAGELDAAAKIAEEIDERALWRRLGRRAAALGDLALAESCARRGEDETALPLLLALGGKREELVSLLNDGRERSPSDRFLLALYAGDARERVRALADGGLHALAFAAARAHRLDDMSEALLRAMPRLADCEEPSPAMDFLGFGALGERIPVTSKIVDKSLSIAPISSDEEQEEDFRLQTVELPVASARLPIVDEPNGVEAELAWNIESVAISTEESEAAKTELTNQTGEDELAARIRRSSLVAWKHFAIGDWERGADLLARQIGLKTLAPLTDRLTEFANGQLTIPSVFGLRSRAVLIADGDAPATRYTPKFLKTAFDALVRLVQRAAFSEANAQTIAILHQTLFARVESVADETNVSEMRAALLRLRTALAAKAAHEEAAAIERKCELALVMAHAQVDAPLRSLFLQVAVASLYRAEDYLNALYVVRRLLKLAEESTAVRAEVVERMRALLRVCESKAESKFDFGFKESNFYERGDERRVDLFALKFFAANAESVGCAFDGSQYEANKRGSLCAFCGICEIGREVKNLRLLE